MMLDVKSGNVFFFTDDPPRSSTPVGQGVFTVRDVPEGRTGTEGRPATPLSPVTPVSSPEVPQKTRVSPATSRHNITSIDTILGNTHKGTLVSSDASPLLFYSYCT